NLQDQLGRRIRETATTLLSLGDVSATGTSSRKQVARLSLVTSAVMVSICSVTIGSVNCLFKSGAVVVDCNRCLTSRDVGPIPITLLTTLRLLTSNLTDTDH